MTEYVNVVQERQSIISSFSGGIVQVMLIVVVGLIAGWLAALVMRERRMGLTGYLITGLVGSFLGTWIFSLVDLSIVSHIASFRLGPIPLGLLAGAFLGAVLLIMFLRLFQGRRKY